MSLLMDFPEVEQNETYRLIFWGETARGRARTDVARAFARKFGIQQQGQLQRLFSGKVVTLKHGLTANQAQKYVEAIQSLGAVCQMERETMRDCFSGTEMMERKTVSFLQNDVDMSQLALSPKED